MKGPPSFRRTAFRDFVRLKLSWILASLFLLLARADTPQTAPLNSESVEIARSHLRQRHDAFEMHANTSDLNTVDVMTFLGGTHVHFEQHFEGIQVLNSRTNVTINRQGEVSFVSSAYKPSIEVASVVPLISSALAQETADGLLGTSPGRRFSDVTLNIYSAVTAIAVGPPEVLWDRTYGDGLIHSVAETSDRGVIATGYWDDPWRIMLLRTDPNGDTLWTRSLMQGQGHSVVQTADGGFAVGGEEFPAIPRDRFLRFNSAGDTLWSRTYGNGSIYSILEMSNGDFILCGSNGDVTLRRVNSQGNTIWLKSYGIPNGDVGYSVDHTSDGGFIVGGSTRRGCNCSSDAWILRMNAVGDTLWTWKYNGPSSSWDRVFSIKSVPGGFVFTGETNLGKNWTGQLNEDGDTLWTKSFPGGGGDGREIVKLGQGGYVICYVGAKIRRFNTAGDSLWSLDVGEVAPLEQDYLYSIKQTMDGGFVSGGNRDCLRDEGGGCSPPHVWLIRLGPEQSTSQAPDGIAPPGRARLSILRNPSRSKVVIDCQIPVAGTYSLVVYDVHGRSVNRVSEGFMPAGTERMEWDGRNHSGLSVGAGVYYVQLKGSGVSLSEKVIIQP